MQYFRCWGLSWWPFNITHPCPCFPQHPTDVDYRVMATFTEFYTTLLGFVNFRLYQTLNLVYPPKVSNVLLYYAVAEFQFVPVGNLISIFFFHVSLMDKERSISNQSLKKIMPWKQKAILRYKTSSFSLFISTWTCAKYCSVFKDLLFTSPSRNCQRWVPVWPVWSQQRRRRRPNWTISLLKGWATDSCLHFKSQWGNFGWKTCDNTVVTDYTRRWGFVYDLPASGSLYQYAGYWNPLNSTYFVLLQCR